MESPTAKLNAYLLQHQAGKIKHKPAYYNFTSSYRSTGSYSSGSSSWLHDVLAMPDVPKLSYIGRDYSKKESTEPVAVYKETVPSTTTLAQADPSTGEYRGMLSPKGELPCCDCKTGHDEESLRQYNELIRHEDISLRREDPSFRCEVENHDSDASFCQCEYRSETPEWVHGLMNENNMTRSMLLPDNYSLMEASLTNTKKKKRKKKSVNQQIPPAEPQAVVKESSHQTHPTVGCTPDTPQTPQQHGHQVPPTPDTANVMLLLQKAMKQLNEVKQAVEDTSVSAITNEISSVTSTHTLAGLSAMSSFDKFTESVTEGEDTLELIQADPTGKS